MSLVRVFWKKSAVFVVLVAIALLLAPTLAITASNGHSSRSDPKTYPIGTVCGDVQAGSYSVSTFAASSTFRGWGVTFSVSDLNLNTVAQTVTAGAGTANAVGDGGKLLSAQFSGVSGTYTIDGGSVHVTLTVTNLKVDGMSVGSPTMPVTLSCDTPDSST